MNKKTVYSFPLRKISLLYQQMKKYFFFLSLTLITLSSCSNHIIVSSTRPSQIENLTVVQAQSEVYLIKKGNGNKSEYSPELSKKAEQVLMYSLENHLSYHHKINRLQLDSATTELINFQLNQMASMINSRKKGEIIEIPPSVDSVMTVRNIDYAAFATHNGFSREHGNYGLQVAKGVLLGIVTLGTFYYVPIKAMSNINVYIIDGNNKSIVYYNHHYLSDGEPCNEKMVRNQVDKAFKKFYEEPRP